MPETLLSPSSVRLFGRVLTDIRLTPADPADPNSGDNHFLRGQFRAGGCRLARIYGYSFEGVYYDLARPAIFLVHGAGERASPRLIRHDNTPDPGEPDTEGVSYHAAAPGRAERSGLAFKAAEFAPDIRVWEYDRGDFSLRLEVDSGPLEQILLETEVAAALEAGAAGRVQSGTGRVQSGSGRVQASHAGRMQVAHRGGKLE